MNIFKDGTLVDVHVSFWSGSKQLNSEDVGLKEENIVDAYKLGRKFLIPEEVIKNFRTIEARARRAVEINSFRFPIGNARFIPKKKFVKVNEELKQLKAEYTAAVDELIANYDKYRQEMIPVYTEAATKAFEVQEKTETTTFSFDSKEEEKKAYIETFLKRIQEHYPSVETLRGKFDLYWDVYEIALPKMAKADAEALEQREAAQEIFRTQTQEKVENFINEVIQTMRQETIDLCTRITNNIKEGKTVRTRTLDSVRDFIDKFQDMNFVGDRKLEEELDSLKNEFFNIYPDEKFEEPEVKDEFSARLDSIVKSIRDFTDIDLIANEYSEKASV